MRITCPNDPEHTRFEVTVHVAELWEVDETGEFWGITDAPGEVTHRPDEEDLYTCAVCGAEARVTRRDPPKPMSNWDRMRQIAGPCGEYLFCSLDRLDDPDGAWIANFHADAVNHGGRVKIKDGHVYVIFDK